MSRKPETQKRDKQVSEKLTTTKTKPRQMSLWSGWKSQQLSSFFSLILTKQILKFIWKQKEPKIGSFCFYCCLKHSKLLFVMQRHRECCYFCNILEENVKLPIRADAPDILSLRIPAINSNSGNSVLHFVILILISYCNPTKFHLTNSPPEK